MKNNIRFVEEMPKVELHVHIEGAVSPDTYWHLAEKNRVKLPVESLQEWKDFFKFKSFAHFIDVYILAVSTIKKPEDYKTIIKDFFRYQKSQNIVYTEAFLSASFMIESFNQEELLHNIKEALIEGEKEYGVEVRLIPDIARNVPDSADAVVDFVINGFKEGVFIGLGLGGLEQGYPAEKFKKQFQRAGEAGLNLVAHAGEGVGAESVLSAIENLKVQRIGHGIRVLEDENVVSLTKEMQIPFEVCPNSNYRLKIVPENENHPIAEMIKQGLLCTLNSDDPLMFSTSLIGEYKLLLEQGLELETLIQLNKNTINSSFLTDVEKIELNSKFDRFIDEFK